MSADEQVLREALRARAEGVDTVDDFVLPSVGLARRRARRALAAGVTAAALVVGGVSVATWAATSSTPTPEPVPATATSAPPEPTPTPTPTASTPSPSATPTSTPSSTSTASAVTVPWAMGATIHLASGTIDMGEGRRVTGFAPLASGGAVVATDAGSPGDDRWRIVDADGDVLDDLGRLMRVQASRDGRLLSRQDAVDGPVTALDERGRRLGSRDLDGSRRGRGRRLDLGDVADRDEGLGGRRRVRCAPSTCACPPCPPTADEGPASNADPDGPTRGCWLLVDLTKRSAPVLLERCDEENPEGFVPTEFSGDGRLLLGHDDADGGFYRGSWWPGSPTAGWSSAARHTANRSMGGPGRSRPMGTRSCSHATSASRGTRPTGMTSLSAPSSSSARAWPTGCTSRAVTSLGRGTSSVSRSCPRVETGHLLADRSRSQAMSADCPSTPPGVSHTTGAPAARTTSARSAPSMRPEPKFVCRSAPESKVSRGRWRGRGRCGR